MSIVETEYRRGKVRKDAASPVRFVAAPFTPMDGQGKLRLGKIAKMAKYLAGQGVTGVFICGTTGEGMSLTIDERKSVAEAWQTASEGKLEIITHVGHQCLSDARVLASHAEKCGVNAIAAIGPTFFDAVSPTSLKDYCLRIAEAAPSRKFYYYHMPSMARVGFSASKVFGLMKDEIATFAGIKFTHDDVADYRRCLKLADGNYEIFFGRDELFLEGLRAGAHSVVGSTYNFATPLYIEIARAHVQGNPGRAEHLQRLVESGIGQMIRYGGLPAIKAVMSLVSGVSCGGVRLPLVPVAPQKANKLQRDLERLGFLSALESASKSFKT